MSGSIRRYNSKVPEYSQVDVKPGVRLDKGPYVGVVKANIDPLRKGRLAVFIEGFGGNENDESQWIPVSYCSPFFGLTSDSGKGIENNFNNTNHSYGMWMTPPDLGVRVLCIFVKGDPGNGYYFGCIPDKHNHHAVPGHASSENLTQADQQTYGKTSLPVAEYNDRNESNRHQNYNKNAKPVNKYLAEILNTQGLITDSIRGLTSSSSKRESPSRVFGLSTPGSPDPEVSILSNQSTTTPLAQKQPAVKVRKPGHQLVLDDGEVGGSNKLVRLKTSTGHQILMHDSAGVIYIASADGNSWIQMSNSGKIDVFSSDSISFHSQKDINFLAEENINLHANKSVKMYSNEKASIESADSVEVLTTQNVKITTTEGKLFVNSESQTVQPLPQQIYDNTIFDTEKNEWVVEELPQDEKKTSIGSRVPEHEPSPTHRSV